MKVLIWLFVILILIGFSIPKEDRLGNKIAQNITKIKKGEYNGR